MANEGYDPWFLEVPEGRAFYPLSAMGFGVWGRGYVVDAEAEEQIHRRLRWSPGVAWAGTMITLLVRSFVGSHQSLIIAVGLVTACSAPALVLYLYAGRLPHSCKRIGVRQSLEHAARTLSYGAMYAQFVLGSIFFLGGAAALAGSFGEPGLSVPSLLIGAAQLTSWALVWRTQVRLRRAGLVARPRLRQP